MARKPNKKFSKNGKDSKFESKRPGDEIETDKESAQEETKSTIRRNVSPGNDPAWYAMFPSLLRDAASLMYSDPLGSKLNLMSRGSWNTPDKGLHLRANDGTRKQMNVKQRVSMDNKANNVPGICAFHLQNTMGFSNSREDPINQMANQIYTQIRYVNSGRKNYDPCDVLMYIHAIIELYSFVYWCRRIYNEAFVYSQTNFYVGRGLLEAEFIDAEDIKQNLNDFRAWLNTMILNVSSYCIPSTIPYIAKKIFQYSGIYIENAFGNIKDQMYMFTPASFMAFALDSAGAGMLTPIPVDVYGGDPVTGLAIPSARSQRMKTADIEKIGNYLLDQIILDEDFSLMSGDILKAFQGNVATLDAVAEEGGIVPIFDPYVLSQFKNATILHDINRGNDGGWITLADGVHKAGQIWQDADGLIRSNNYVSYATTTGEQVDNNIITASMAKILTVDNPAPTQADNIEASRLTVMCELNSDANQTYRLICGTEVVLGVSLITRANNDWVKYWFGTNFAMVGDYLGSAGLALANAAVARSFKYAPTMIIGIANAAGDALDSYVTLQNVDQYTVIGIEEIEKMHRCALFSLLFVPTVAKNFNNA